LEGPAAAKEERKLAWAKRLQSSNLQAIINLKLVARISLVSSSRTAVTDSTQLKEFPISYLPRVHRAIMAINKLTITISSRTSPEEL